MEDGWNLVNRGKQACAKTAAINIEFTGYDINKLEKRWFAAVNRFFAPGGGAEQRFGPIARAKLMSEKNGPVHQSRFNTQDERWTLTFSVTAISGETKSCHVFDTGKGTGWVGDVER